VVASDSSAPPMEGGPAAAFVAEKEDRFRRGLRRRICRCNSGALCHGYHLAEGFVHGCTTGDCSCTTGARWATVNPSASASTVMGERRAGQVERVHDRLDDLQHREGDDAVAHQHAEDADSLGSRYLFPGKRGAMLSRNFPARRLLAQALGRASIVEHYRHVCRRKCCGEVVLADDAGIRRCAKDNRLLWPVPVPIHFRVHDARHTGITLLLDAGLARTRRAACTTCGHPHDARGVQPRPRWRAPCGRREN
jgi:hypothetical protein